MPLIFQDKKDKFSFAIWQITENLSFFLDKIDLFKSEQKEIEKLKNKRLMEWLASRYLVSLIEAKNQRSACLKDKYGKPYLHDSKKKISISHSGVYMAASISDFSTGIDIQMVSDKINKIKTKFLSKAELEICSNDIIKLNRYWTAKEALYKAYGKKGLNFIDDISVEPFVEQKNYLKSTGAVFKNKNTFDYNICSRNIQEAILTIAIEK